MDAAERLIGELTNRFSVLAKNPGVGRRGSELPGGLRSFPVSNYRIYYRQPKKGVVLILYVRHAARDERKLPGYYSARLRLGRPHGQVDSQDYD